MRLTDISTLIKFPGVNDPEIPIDELIAVGAGFSAAAAVGWTMRKRAIKNLLEQYAVYKIQREEQKLQKAEMLKEILKEWGARDIGAGIGTAAEGIMGGGILPEGLLDFSKEDAGADKLMLQLLEDEFVDIDAIAVP